MAYNRPLSLPAGTLVPFAGATAPNEWLLCYGQAISRATYAALFAAIGTAWGAGDGSTTFNLPDLRGRALFGKDDMGGAAANRLTTGGGGINGAALAAVGGGETVTLDTTKIPSHTHDGAINFRTNQATAGTGKYAADTTAIPTAAQGGGGAHGNVPPGAVVNYIIKI
jgi:microcystin-dependent protein